MVFLCLVDIGNLYVQGEGRKGGGGGIGRCFLLLKYPLDALGPLPPLSFEISLRYQIIHRRVIHVSCVSMDNQTKSNLVVLPHYSLAEY